jgi:hypothetical protein
VLVTEHDISSVEKRQQFADTVNTLLEIGIVPVINENDVVRSRPPSEDDQVVPFFISALLFSNGAEPAGRSSLLGQ